jgi:hypothetical protein
MRLKRWVLLWLCVTLSLGAKPLFELTPEMYASIMVKSMEGNLPQTFKRDGLSLVVTKVYNEKSKIYIQATTEYYKGIIEELKKHRSLPEDIQKQCKEFAKLSFVNQGVNYVLHVEAKNEKPLVVVYDKEACNAGFDPHQKIFIGGYNRYGFDQNGYTRKGVKF